MMLESALESVLVKGVRAVGGMTVKLMAVVAGTPDRLVLMPNGVSYLVELKTSTGRLAPVQEYWHEKAAGLGHKVVVLYGADAIRDWIGGLGG